MARVGIFELKPTQLALGILEVDEKVYQIRDLAKKDVKKYLKKNPITVVRAPNREYYIVDGHHHTAACWLAGLDEVYVKVIFDFSKTRMSYVEFWKKMKKKGWCHLYDKFGDGPREPMYLAPDIRGLGDDPYRSLAWLVRRQGGFDRTKEKFCQFKWANFFRKNEVFHPDFDLDYTAATERAHRLARSKEARDLPGYIGSKRN